DGAAGPTSKDRFFKSKLKPSLTEEQHNEIKEIPQKSKFKEKGKAKAIEATDDIVEIPPPLEPPKPCYQKRHKAGDDEERTKMKPPSSESYEADITMTTQQKQLSYVRSISVQCSHDEETKETSDAEKNPVKKRRKISIFQPSAAPFTFEAIVSVFLSLDLNTT
ncbi:hypothetical protein C0995_006964, partial [Termitomyces sp. Mi166